MIHLALVCLLLAASDNTVWLLRGGYDSVWGVSASPVVHAYRSNSLGSPGTNPSQLPIHSALLLWNGDPAGALAQWKVGGMDVPATRDHLLGALVWFGRTRLSSHLGVGHAPPPDMIHSRYPTHSECVLVLGWMARLPDGLFHPEFRLGAADLARLAPGHTGVLGKSMLDSMVEGFFR